MNRRWNDPMADGWLLWSPTHRANYARWVRHPSLLVENLKMVVNRLRQATGHETTFCGLRGRAIECQRSEQFDGGPFMGARGLTAGHRKVSDGLSGHSVFDLMGFQHFCEVAIEIPAPFGIELLS